MSEDSYIKIPTEIVKNHNISNLEFRVLANIVFLSSYNNGHSFLGSFKLSSMCGIGRAALRKALSNLETMHLISISQRGNYSRSNDILLTIQDGVKFLQNGGSAKTPEVDLKDSPRVDLKDSPVDLKEPPYKDINLNNINLNNKKTEVDLKEPPKKEIKANNHIATGDVAPVRSMPENESAKNEVAACQCELEDYLLADGFFDRFKDLKPWVEVVKWCYDWGFDYIVRPAGRGGMFSKKIAENRVEIEKFFAEKKQKITVFSQKTRKIGEIIIKSNDKTAI